MIFRYLSRGSDLNVHIYRCKGLIVIRLGLTLGVLSASAAAVLSTDVIAMEEQRGQIPCGMSVPVTQKAQAQEDSVPSRRRENGAEIRIPGLGKIGTLPEMDFGLDLLYGAIEDGNTRTTPGFSNSQDTDEQLDLMIRGTVKHRF